MTDNAQIVRDFIAAWSRLDAEELASYFAEDGVYHNIPTAPVAGREKVRKFIESFSASWRGTEWEVVNLAVAGNVVFAERVDRTRVGEKRVELPCCGVFELENGKIKVWRDYFDLSTFLKAVG